MRRYIKKRLLELCNTLHNAFSILADLIGEKKYEQACDILAQMQEVAVAIGERIEQEEEHSKIIKNIEEFCESLYNIFNKINLCDVRNELENSKKQLNLIQNEIVHNIVNSKLEIVFLPYKASMWTSLESIWKAAEKDDMCNAVVVPIPYYDIGNRDNVRKIYEGGDLPYYVPVTDYREYDLKSRHPDIIIIHNPYDNTNNLTSVHPSYYSIELKKVTDCLVYSPYFSFGTYKKGTSDFLYVVPGTINADKIIVQSERVKNIFKEYGFSESKLLVTGSPKMDAVIGYNRDNINMPEEWKSKLQGKKVILLNTHLSYFPVSYYNTSASGNYAVRFHDEILKAVLNREDVGMIWRPHPLLKNIIYDRFPECIPYIEYFENKLSLSSNCIVDLKGEYSYAFAYSDAMISTWSSLVNEYMVTKKPIMIFQSRLNDEMRKNSPIDRNINYFRFGKNSVTFDEFINNVIEGYDPLYDERMFMLKNALLNLDGTAGQKAYKEIRNMYLIRGE